IRLARSDGKIAVLYRRKGHVRIGGVDAQFLRRPKVGTVPERSEGRGHSPHTPLHDAPATSLAIARGTIETIDAIGRHERKIRRILPLRMTAQGKASVVVLPK